MPYKNIEDHRNYQRDWAKRKRENLPTRLTVPLTEEERKIRKRRRYNKWARNVRKKRDKLFGTICHFCPNKSSALHKKDGKPHEMNVTWIRKAIDSPEEWVSLCSGCHKGVHFCMEKMSMEWEEIEKKT